MNTSFLLKFFIVFCAIYLLLPFIDLEEVQWYLKPFLVLLLMTTVEKSAFFPSKKTLLIALFFCLLGDIILMFAHKGELYFVFGIVAFLIGQLIYIKVFINQKATQINTQKTIYWIGAISIITYYAVLITTLYPKLGSLQIPVIVYGAVITTMLFTAFKGFFTWQNPGAAFVLLGALFFVSSDSLLAFNKFYGAIQNSDFFIMSTYSIAQLCIVYGILTLNKKMAI